MRDQRDRRRQAPRGPAIPGDHPIPPHPECPLVLDTRSFIDCRVDQWIEEDRPKGDDPDVH